MTKILITLSLLLNFSLIATAQVKQIELDPFKEYTPKIKIADNQLFAITLIGVYSQGIDESGNLIEETLLPSEIFENFKYDVVDFIKSGEKIIVVTGNSIKERNAILKSIDNGKTWVDISDKFANSEFSKIEFCQCYYNKDDIYVQIGFNLYYSTDFGDSFECTSSHQFTAEKIECHNFDSKTLIILEYQPYIWEYEAWVSFDSGKTIYNWWDSDSHTPELTNFMRVRDIAFHYSDPNKMIVSGNKIVYSEDCGKNWELTNQDKYEGDYIYGQLSFDKRGSDRLYLQLTRYNSLESSNKLYYSDDFGATLTELCSVGENESDYIVDFVQQNNKLYTISKDFKVYQIDLDLVETAVEEVSIDDGRVSVSVVGNNLQINSQIPVSAIDIFNIGGIKLISQDCVAGNIDISELAKGTYVARLTTSDGNTISVKFNK